MWRHLAAAPALAGGLVLFWGGCVARPTPPPANAALLLDTEEKFHSEILQRDRRVVMTFEMVDGVTLPHHTRLERGAGHWIAAGRHRVQFHLLLPPAGLTDSRAREARGVADVELAAGKAYRISGLLKEGMKDFFIAEAQTGKSISPAVDVGFFAPVPGPTGFIPVLIPVPR